jgi:hypothetical protein
MDLVVEGCASGYCGTWIGAGCRIYHTFYNSCMKQNVLWSLSRIGPYWKLRVTIAAQESGRPAGAVEPQKVV